MTINPSIFKAYDIRGIYNTDLSEEVAFRLGQAYVQLRKEDGLKNKITVAVGQDMRLSSPALKEKLIAGFLEAGADVVDIGLSSTPSFYFAVANYGYDGGIIVSASHNPGEYNGFKITREKAIPVSGETGMMRLRDLVMENNFTVAEQKGKITENKNVLTDMIKHDLQYGKLDKIKNLKIVADAANSMGATYLEKIFEHLPCELIKMNWELDGTFPAHEADPLKEENLNDLKNKVLEENAALGIATDGDGDRIFFVDNLGRTVDQSIIRGILSMLFLKEKPGSKICYDIRPGKITEDMIRDNGGIPIVTRVGHSLIKEQTLKENAYFAGESSGHFFLNMPIGCYEVPVIVTLKLLEYFSEEKKPVSEIIRPYQKYFHSGEINSIVENKEKVFSELEKKYHDAKINKLDGITIEYENFWFNVRGSNTEPKIRLNLEGKTEKIMEEKRDEVLEVLTKC